MSRTKEERYILKLYEMAHESGSVQNRKDCFVVGASLGLSEKVVVPITNILAQANFIKKVGDKDICLTTRGIELAESLRDKK